jgi:hypothetical protein
MTEERSNAMTLGALGMLSGAVAWASVLLANLLGESSGLHLSMGVWGIFLLNPLSLLPGLAFGLAIGLLLHHRGQVEVLRQVGYVAASGLAYFCAYHVAFHIDQTFFRWGTPHGEVVVGFVVSGILAGLVGSLLLGLVTIRLLRVPARVVPQWSVGVGGAAGVLLEITTHDHTEWGWSLLAFFVLWQGAYAASLAPLLRAAPASGDAARVG